MSKLAHSNDETMTEIETNYRCMEEREPEPKLPSALTIIKAISFAGVLKGHPDYMTKLQMIDLCGKWLTAQRKPHERR